VRTQATELICKLSKKGTTPSQIGVILRDLHGVGQVSTVTGTKILRILRKQGLAPEIPEDLYFLIKKAVSMRKHLDRFRKDRDAKFRLILVESRIHRLARYYKVRAVRGMGGAGCTRASPHACCTCTRGAGEDKPVLLLNQAEDANYTKKT